MQRKLTRVWKTPEILDTFNLVIGKNIKPSIPTEISINGSFVENDADIASAFNEFFAGIGPQLSNAIDHR